MGLQVPTYIGPSIIHGTGLFTTENLKKGTVLWLYESNKESRKRISELSPLELSSTLHYGYINPLQPEYIVICGDNACYWNFPPEGTPANAVPSTELEQGEAVIVASRDIKAGEELLIDARSDLDYKRKLFGSH
jgi:SET domain-containing protein